jgi:hypothetical protein
MLRQKPHCSGSHSTHPPSSPTTSAPLHPRRLHFTSTRSSIATCVISRRRRHQKVVAWHLDLRRARACRLVPGGLVSHSRSRTRCKSHFSRLPSTLKTGPDYRFACNTACWRTQVYGTPSNASCSSAVTASSISHRLLFSTAVCFSSARVL